MPGFTLRDRLSRGDKIFAGWISSADARMAETVVQVGFDAALFDLQHGDATLTDIRDGIAAVRRLGLPSGVRAGLDGFADAAHALDLGAELAILPMINSAADAARLVETLKYPPVGGRSWGCARALNLLGLKADAYRTDANAGTLALAMIETRAALDALDDILAVPGLDGVFVGPSDLSISLSGGAALDHRLPEVATALERIVAAAKAGGKVTAIFCAGGEAARRNAEIGFDILAVGTDFGFLTDGARAALIAARGSAGEGAARY